MSISNTDQNTNQNNNNEDLYKNPIAYYQLNQEGIKKYGTIKKQQLLETLKWSITGTAVGYLSSFMIDIAFRRSSNSNKDLIKAGSLMFFVMFFSFIGYKVSFYNFQKKQLELCRLYGKEVDSSI